MTCIADRVAVTDIASVDVAPTDIVAASVAGDGIDNSGDSIAIILNVAISNCAAARVQI